MTRAFVNSRRMCPMVRSVGWSVSNSGFEGPQRVVSVVSLPRSALGSVLVSPVPRLAGHPDSRPRPRQTSVREPVQGRRV